MLPVGIDIHRGCLACLNAGRVWLEGPLFWRNSHGVSEDCKFFSSPKNKLRSLQTLVVPAIAYTVVPSTGLLLLCMVGLS